MKHLILIFTLLLTINFLWAQDVTFTFANAQITNDGTDDFYEGDIMIESTSGFKLGAGLLYFNYNTIAFGSSIFTNGNITVTSPTGTSPSYLLGAQAIPGFGIYSSFVTNDNTSSRVAFSWQQALSSGSLPANNVTSTPTPLFHLKIKFVDANVDPSICFESMALFTDQTYTACGPASFGLADCIGAPGIQITNDNYDCSMASPPPLPVELISFSARPDEQQARLDWITASESNNKGFEIERMNENEIWETIGFVEGNGNSNNMNTYRYYDEKPKIGYNYYRLKQIDFDGKFEYSEIESVLFVEHEIDFSIYPNPTFSDHEVFVKIPKDETQVLFFDSSGKLIYENNYAVGTHSINLKEFAKGIYFVKFINGRNTSIEKLIVNE